MKFPFSKTISVYAEREEPYPSPLTHRNTLCTIYRFHHATSIFRHMAADKRVFNTNKTFAGVEKNHTDTYKCIYIYYELLDNISNNT